MCYAFMQCIPAYMTTVKAEHIAYACVQVSFVFIDILNTTDL